ncbi:MAG: DUF1835 domain-containing protein [Polyangiaceae bacterium]
MFGSSSVHEQECSDMMSAMRAIRAVHITAGTFAASAIARRFGASRKSVVAVRDDLSEGPLTPMSDVAKWCQARRDFWEQLVPAHEGDYPLSGYMQREQMIPRARRLVLWVGRELSGQLLLVWLPQYLKATIGEVSHLRIGEIPASYEHSASLTRGRWYAHWPRETELTCLKDAWAAVTEQEPELLVRLLQARNPVLPQLTHALGSLIARYPSASTGLTARDEVLLASVRERGPRLESIVSHTLAALAKLGDESGDLVLIARLRTLACQRVPAIVTSAKGTPQAGSEVWLTDHGVRVLERRQNNVAANGIDEWVAGVHLSSEKNRVWFRTQDGSLVR